MSTMAERLTSPKPRRVRVRTGQVASDRVLTGTYDSAPGALLSVGLPNPHYLDGLLHLPVAPRRTNQTTHGVPGVIPHNSEGPKLVLLTGQHPN